MGFPVRHTDVLWCKYGNAGGWTVLMRCTSAARWLPDDKPVCLVVVPLVVLFEDSLPSPVVSDEAAPQTLG